MKRWKALAITHRTHYLSALCRSLFTNSCWIFATSLFVKVVGSKGYSQLFFFASLSSLLYYLYFALRGHKGYEPYNVYRAVLVVALLASVGCFLYSFFSFSKELNEILLYCFVVSVMTVDLIGTTLGPMVLQATVNPAIFREVYQRIVTSELIARIGAAVIVWLLSQGHLLNYLYPIAWTLLVAHFILFGITVRRMRSAELKSGIRAERVPALENVGGSLRFIFSNPLVRVAMCVMVWSTITKFVVENLFYQVADASFDSARQLASFVSVLTIVIYALSLTSHHFLSQRINARLPLSVVLSIQPTNVLVFGGIALLLPPFWPLILLMVTYNIIHRSIQMPMSRQCLVPVPRRKRGTIVSLISIVIASATIITSGVMAALKNSLHMQDFLVFLLLLGAAILFMVTSLDSYYIRNLWSLFQETRSGSWQDEPQSESFSEIELDNDAAALPDVKPSSSDLKLHPALESYAFSSDKSVLKKASEDHRQLLLSGSSDALLLGLKICFVTDFPWFRKTLANAVYDTDARIRKFAENAQEVQRNFHDMTPHSSVFRRRIRSVAISLMENDADRKYISTLKGLLNWTDIQSVDTLAAALSNAKFEPLRHLILDSIVEAEMRFDITALVERMYENDYGEAAIYRHLLEELPFCKASNQLRYVIEEQLCQLKREDIIISQKPASGERQLQTFMHTLFLEEYRLSSRESDQALANSIAEFPGFSSDESAIVRDMHLSFLKRSELFSRWEAIMA